MSNLHGKLMTVPSTLSLPAIEMELADLSCQIDRETNERRKDWLCAAYQALLWARNPDGYGLPSSYEVPRPTLKIVSGNGGSA